LNIDLYVKKIHDSVNIIQTDFLILADNDDFYFLDNFQFYINFLIENNSYIAAKGSTIDLFTSDSPFLIKKDNDSIKSKYYRASIRNVNSIQQENPTERVSYSCNNFIKKDYFSNWYSIYKTNTLRNTFAELKKSNVNSLFVFEILFHVLNTYQGKIFIDKKPFYVRQYGTSTSNGHFSDEKLTKDLLIDNNFQQFYKCLNSNNKIVSKEDVYTLLLSIFQSIQIFFAYRQIYNQKNSKSLIRKIIMIIKSNKLVVNFFYFIKGNFNGNELNSIKVIKLKVIEKYFIN
jgi:glycosyltransferase domain-containing protein